MEALPPAGLVGLLGQGDETFRLPVADPVRLQQQDDVRNLEGDLGHLHAPDGGRGHPQYLGRLLAPEAGPLAQVLEASAQHDLAHGRGGPGFTHFRPPHALLRAVCHVAADRRTALCNFQSAPCQVSAGGTWWVGEPVHTRSFEYSLGGGRTEHRFPTVRIPVVAPGNALIPQLTGACSGTTVRRYAFDVPARTESVSLARRRSRAMLTGWGHDEELHETVALVISELVTNAVVHTAGRPHTVRTHRPAAGVADSRPGPGLRFGRPSPVPLRRRGRTRSRAAARGRGEQCLGLARRPVRPRTRRLGRARARRAEQGGP